MSYIDLIREYGIEKICCTHCKYYEERSFYNQCRRFDAEIDPGNRCRRFEWSDKYKKEIATNGLR